MDIDVWIGLLLIPLLLLLSALLVAAEIAFVTIRRTELDDLVHAGRSGALAAKALVERLDRAIAAIQVGITAIGLMLGWFAESALADLLRPLAARLVPGLPGAVSHAVAGAAILILLTGVQVTLGELVPKAVALQHPRTVALLLSRPLLLLSRVAAPVIALLNGATRLVLRLVGVREGAPASRAHSTRELATLIDETRRAGALKPEQAEVLLNVFRLSGKTARDVMVPLERAGMIDLRWPVERVLESVIACAHTRMPVFDGDRARVVGLVNAKDVFRAFRTTGTVDLTQVMRPIAFVPAEARVEEQLQRFRARRLHMAIVRAGEAPVGLVTLEDLIEEVVGDIEDEHDPVAHATPRAC